MFCVCALFYVLKPTTVLEFSLTKYADKLLVYSVKTNNFDTMIGIFNNMELHSLIDLMTIIRPISIIFLFILGMKSQWTAIPHKNRGIANAGLRDQRDFIITLLIKGPWTVALCTYIQVINQWQMTITVRGIP